MENELKLHIVLGGPGGSVWAEVMNPPDETSLKLALTQVKNLYEDLLQTEPTLNG